MSLQSPSLVHCSFHLLNPNPILKSGFACSFRFPRVAPCQVSRAFRRHSLFTAMSGSSSSTMSGSSSSMELPLLPFQMSEVLIPSESRTLHLYEARYLALLEEYEFMHNSTNCLSYTLQSLSKKTQLFVHFVLDPVLFSIAPRGASYAARYGCLVVIENVKRLEIGALVTIRGISRVNIIDLIQMDPYLRGLVVPMLDDFSDQESEKVLKKKLLELTEFLINLHNLQIKLKASKEELLQTRTKNSMEWAEKDDFDDYEKAFIPKPAERVSFAALQPISGMTDSELLALQKEKLRAMDLRDTLERVDNGIQFTKNCINMVAAKLAIQSMET